MTILSRLDPVARREHLKSLAPAAEYHPGCLAANCHISIRQLERYFDKDFGTTPRNWLHQLRMKTAETLLPESESIKDVSYQLGYKHTSEFCRAFKEHCGMTATEFLQHSISVPEFG